RRPDLQLHCGLPISYTPYIPLRVRRRTRRASRRPLLAAVALLMCFGAVALLARACLSSASAAGGARTTSVVKLPAPSLTGLAAGTCQSLAPTGKSRGRTVYIVPGQGGPGARQHR